MEATEEHHPVHLHVAVLVAPGHKVLLPNLAAGMVAQRPTVPVQSTTQLANSGDVALAKQVASGAPPAHHTYVVRQGDTMWDIATRNGVSVDALTKANAGVGKHSLKPGLTLVIPERTGL